MDQIGLHRTGVPHNVGLVNANVGWHGHNGIGQLDVARERERRARLLARRVRGDIAVRGKPELAADSIDDVGPANEQGDPHLADLDHGVIVGELCPNRTFQKAWQAARGQLDWFVFEVVASSEALTGCEGAPWRARQLDCIHKEEHQHDDQGHEECAPQLLGVEVRHPSSRAHLAQLPGRASERACVEPPVLLARRVRRVS